MEPAAFDHDEGCCREPLSTEKRSREARRRDLTLDHALEETFPASDPIASGLFD